MEQMRERVARAIAPFLEGGREFDKMPVNRLQLREWARQAMCGFNDATQDDAYEAADALQPEIDRRVAEEKANLEGKFRCVVSHATGGNFQDIDASLNEISVRISQFRTQLWEQAKQSGAKEEKAKLLERFDEDELEQIISNSLDMDWRPRDAARAARR